MPLPMGPLVGLGMRTLLALVVASLLPFSLFAQEVETAPVVFPRAGVIHTSAAAFCAAEFAAQQGQFPSGWTNAGPESNGGTAPLLQYRCMVNRPNDPPLLLIQLTASCPATYSANFQSGQCERVMTCAAKAGMTKRVNVTAGWARSNRPNTNDIVINLPIEANRCDGTCAITLAPVAERAWRSQVPAANGLHRISGDFQATYTGATCTGTTPTADPTAPTPECPRALGEVNGRPVCFGTPAAPLPQAPRPPGIPPEGYGNPPAGTPPPGGPTTPAAGAGGNAGGGSNAAIPGGGSEGNGQGDGTPGATNPDGTGTGNNGTGTGGVGGGGGEGGLDPCGLPGTPPCRIDETGTPDGSGTYSDATNGVNSNRDSAVQGVNDAAGTAGKFTGWTFTFALPSGCSEVPLAAFAPYITGINVCTWQGVIHDPMAMIWLAVTVWCCIGMVGRAIGGGT